jgi:hypothetical protein
MNAASLTDLGTEWRNMRVLHPLYVAIAREFVIETPACADLEGGSDAPGEEAIEQARAWFAVVDERIQVHQLRQFLQTTVLADNESLRILLLRHLQKEDRTPADRDKIDFLLVQFFSHSTPSRLDDKDCDLEYVAQVLEPVLGSVDALLPEWLAPLEQMIRAASRCRRMSELFASKVLESGRKLKVESKDNYFLPVAMVAFTRFSFLMRRFFFRLMHDDLNAILDGLRELENRGITMLDCRRAHFSHQEPTDRLRMICHSWKVMFHAEYSSGQPLKMLADLRTVVEEALNRAETAKAAAAGVGTSAAPIAASAPKPAAVAVSMSTKAAAPEFDISAGQHDDGDVV